MGFSGLKKVKALVINGRIHALCPAVTRRRHHRYGGIRKWGKIWEPAVKVWNFCLIFALFTVAGLAENVNLFWNSNTEPNVTHYDVRRGDATGGPYTVIGTVVQTSNPTYLDAGVDLTTDKFYVVTAVNNTGLESPFSNEVTASSVPVGTPPGAPIITITITVSP